MACPFGPTENQAPFLSQLQSALWGLAAAPFFGTAEQLNFPSAHPLLLLSLLLALLLREFPHKVLLAHYCLTVCFPRTPTWNNLLSQQP